MNYQNEKIKIGKGHCLKIAIRAVSFMEKIMR